MELARSDTQSTRPSSPARGVSYSSNAQATSNLLTTLEVVGGIQGAHDFQINNSSISVVGGDNHTHTSTHIHVHYNGTAEDLKTILGAIPNLRRIQQDTLAKATPGTILWLLDCKEFLLFIDVNGVLKIMWGSGIPGAGKTIVASIVINKLEALAREWGNQICVAYIYIRYSDKNEDTVRSILEILVKQTVERHPDCFVLAQQAYDCHVREGTRPTEGELLTLLRRFAAKKKATFYVLDAVDEAPVGIRLALVQKLSSLGVRLFITSRPLPIIEARFPAAHTFPILAQDQDLDLHIAEKIEGSEYLQDLLQRGGPEFKQHLITTVKAKCGGMFLHASLQLDALQQCFAVHDAMQILVTFPQHIEDVYRKTWERIIQSEPHHASLAKAAIVWVLNAKQSLTIEQLRRALATSPDTHSFEPSRLVPEAALMSVCRGVITVDKESRLVRLVHYTAKKPLEDLLCVPFPQPHSLLAAVCIARLTDCGFQNPIRASEKELNTTLDADPLLAYAYNAWVFHAQQSLDLEFIVNRMSTFIAGCRAFPHILHYGGLYFVLDSLGPLHIVALYNLPIAFAQPHNCCDPNTPTARQQRTPLHLACIGGNYSAAESLLSMPDILVNVEDRDGETAFMMAFDKSCDGIIRLLLDHPRIMVDMIEIERRFGLSASRSGGEYIRKILLAHHNVEVGVVDDDADGGAPLIVAPHRSPKAVVMLLCNSSPNFSLSDSTWATPLLLTSSGERNESAVKLLLAYPNVDVNPADQDEVTALTHESCNAIVALLLTYPVNDGNGIEVNQAREGWDTSLMLASLYGRGSSARLLLTPSIARVHLVNNAEYTVLMHACQNGHESIVKYLLDQGGIEVNLAGKDGSTALILASQRGYIVIVKLLLAHPDIKPNLADARGDNPLIAASRNSYGGIVKLLLARTDIQVNSANHDRNTALMEASSKGYDAIVTLLLAHPSIDVNQAGKGGDTALLLACIHDRESTVKLLLTNPNLKIHQVNDAGLTVLMCASQYGVERVVECLLGEPSIDADLVRNDGNTALLLASMYGHERTASLLLKRSYRSINQVNDAGYTVLMYASQHGFESIVGDLLQDDYIEVNQAGEDGFTALMLATQGDHIDIVKLLIAHCNMLKILEHAMRREDSNSAGAC